MNVWGGFPVEVIEAVTNSRRPIPQGVFELIMRAPSADRPRAAFECAAQSCVRMSPDPRISRLCVIHRPREEALSADELAEWVSMAAVGDLRSSAARAVEVQNEILNDDMVPSAVRLAAAQSILDRTGLSKGVEITVRQEESSALEILNQRFDALVSGMDMQIVDGEIVEDPGPEPEQDTP